MMMRSVALIAVLVVAAIAATSAHAFYEEGGDVVVITPDNYKEEIEQTRSVVIAEFYAPWCGHCKMLTPEWKKAAAALKGIAKVVAVDADKYAALGNKVGVSGFPTIKVFGSAGKKKPLDYEGGRKAHDIVEAVLKEVEEVTNVRLGKKAAGGGSDVIEGTDAKLDELMAGSDPFLVAFTAPWCGHCKSMKPQFAKAATLLKDQVQVLNVDATKHTKYNQRFKVEGFPSILWLPKGGDGDHVSYEGDRKSDAIAAWVQANKK